MAIHAWHSPWLPQDVEIKEDNSIGGEYFQLRSLSLRHRQFSGEWSPWLVRELVCRQDAAAILLFDPKLKKLVMVEQFRIGLVKRQHEQSPWLLEIVAGLLETGEDPVSTIKREAQEEAGCEVKQLHKIMEFYNTPGGFSEKTSLFYGTVDAQNAGGVHGLAHEHEDIKVHLVAVEEILTALDNGQFVTSASTALALQWFALHYHNNTLPF